MLPDHLRRLGEVLALGDDLAHALNGHPEDAAMSVLRR